MSQEKAQLIAPIGIMTVSGMTATGVITASSFTGNIVGSAKSLVNGTDVTAGVVTATSFVGNLTGNIQRLADSAPNINVGVTTASSFVGNLTGSVTDLTSAPAITVGMVTATTLEGPVTGNVTGNVSGLAGGLGVNYNGGWTGAGTSQIKAGVVTATTFYGDGSNLEGVSSGPVSQQAVTIDGASTSIDLSNGNLIYASQSASTTVSFANSENGNVYFVRVKDATTTARTITWPDRILWEGGTAPTLNTGNFTNEAQVLLLVTRDMGVTWYGKEIFGNPGGYELFSWGANSYGTIGNNNRTTYSSPIQIPGAWEVYKTSEQSDVNFFAKGNTLWSVGYDGAGGLGQNNTQKYSSPTQIGTDSTWSTLSNYRFNPKAVKTDGTMWTWGQNERGQMGLNTQAPNDTGYSSPMQIPGSTWSIVTSGNQNALSIKTNGTMWGWGVNEYGQLGVNDRTNRSSPTQIGTDTDWAKLTFSTAYSSAAIKTNGTLWTWGRNDYMTNLGTEDRINRSSPTQIGTATNWSNVTSSRQSFMATKTDNTLWVWGCNEKGGLGLNEGDNSITTGRSSPTQLPGSWKLDQIVSIGNGEGNMAMKADGSLWGWGTGNTVYGTDDARSSPTQMPGTWTTLGGGKVIAATQ